MHRVGLVVLVLLASLGCRSAESELLGKWQGPGNDSIEFFKDGTVRVGDYGVTIGATYTLVEPGVMRIDTGRGQVVARYSLEGDTLTYTQNRTPVVFHRVSE